MLWCRNASAAQVHRSNVHSKWTLLFTLCFTTFFFAIFSDIFYCFRVKPNSSTILYLHLAYYPRSFLAGMCRRKQTLSLYRKCNSMRCLKKGALKNKQSIFINYNTLSAALLSIHTKTHTEFPTGFSDQSQAGRAEPALSPVKPRGWLHIWNVGSHHQHWCSSHCLKWSLLTAKAPSSSSQSPLRHEPRLPSLPPQSLGTHWKPAAPTLIYFLFLFKQALKYTLHFNKWDKTMPPDSCNCAAALSRSISAFCMWGTCLFHSNLMWTRMLLQRHIPQ